MPLIQDKHALRKCFASIDSSYFYPEYERGKPFSFTASRMNYFPQYSSLSRLCRLVQYSLSKIYKYCGSVLIRSRFFWFDDFIKFVTLPSSRMSGLWQTFGFKTSSTESSWTYLRQLPKLSTHQIISLYWNKQNSIQLTKSFAFSSRHKRFSRFLHHSIDSRNN